MFDSEEAYDEEINYAEAIDFVFGDDTPPSIGDELRSMGATVADGNCSECDGTLFDYENEVICSNCSLVIGADTSTSSSKTSWDYFNENRPRYYNSNRPRCIGGFPNTYDWVKREDIDHPVKEIEPTSFYG